MATETEEPCCTSLEWEEFFETTPKLIKTKGSCAAYMYASYKSINGWYSYRSVNAVCSFLCTNAMFCILATNCFCSMLSLNSAFSILSVVCLLVLCVLCIGICDIFGILIDLLTYNFLDGFSLVFCRIRFFRLIAVAVCLPMDALTNLSRIVHKA